MSENLRIQQVQEIAAAALAQSDQKSGRVRAVPDTRTIRYYTTIGLIDRPTEMVGRTAYYGQKHVLQIVAIKRLQAMGLTLAQVQEKLLGINNRQLKKIADLPEKFWDNHFEFDKNNRSTRRPAKAPNKSGGMEADGNRSTNRECHDKVRPNFWTAAAVESKENHSANMKTQLTARIPLGNDVYLELPVSALQGINETDLMKLVSKISAELGGLGNNDTMASDTAAN